MVTACTLTHIRTGGELTVGVGEGDGLAVVGAGVDGVGDGLGGGLLLGGSVGLAGALVLADGEAAGLLAVALAEGDAAAASSTDDTESSCISASLTATELMAAVAGCCPHVLVAATVVYAGRATCVPARKALTRPEDIIAVPANTVSADDPTRRTLMMAPSSSWSSHQDRVPPRLYRIA